MPKLPGLVSRGGALSLVLILSIVGPSRAAGWPLPAPSATEPATLAASSAASDEDVQRWMSGFFRLRAAEISRQSVANIVGVPVSRFDHQARDPQDPAGSDGGDALGRAQGWPFDLVLIRGHDLHFRFEAIYPHDDAYRPPACVDAAWARERIEGSGWKFLRRDRGSIGRGAIWIQTLQTWVYFRRVPPDAPGELIIEYNARSGRDDEHGCLYDIWVRDAPTPGFQTAGLVSSPASNSNGSDVQ